MKNVILPILSPTCLLWLLITPTQGTLVVSNLEAPSAGNEAIGGDSWIAQTFFFRAVGAALYRLDSVQLRMGQASGVPGEFTVSLYSAPVIPGVDAVPQDFLGYLDGPSDPSSSGEYTYHTSGIELTPHKLYFVVVDGSTPIAEGAYNWSASEGSGVSGGWVIPSDWSYTSSGSLTWERHVQEGAFQMGIHATVVPEPSTLCLAGLGLGVLGLVRRQAKSTAEPGNKVRVTPSFQETNR